MNHNNYNKMRYKNKDITKLSDWAIVLYLNYHGEATNKDMATQFNNSTSIVSIALKRLEKKGVVQGVRSSEPGKWREVIYTINNK